MILPQHKTLVADINRAISQARRHGLYQTSIKLGQAKAMLEAEVKAIEQTILKRQALRRAHDESQR